MPNETRTIYAYAHTHWDREWYQPFESFRLQLLDLVRNLIPRLEDGSIPRFYLDGQSIILEDVTAIEPELKEPLQRLMRDGKLAAGPWYVLPDEMLVGGESLIRNLSIGMKVTNDFGEPSLVGYCPDTFGHSQDLPTILNGFGIKNAMLWRGVPSLQMGPVFWWNAPSGARVLTYHLTFGYFRTDFHDLAFSQGSEEMQTRIFDFANKFEDGWLLPIGGDHVAPPANLRSLIDVVNARAAVTNADFRIESTTLADFVDRMEMTATGDFKLVQAVDGELRFNRAAAEYERAYLLYGVLSTRLYLKRANRLAEYRLGRLLEPVRAIANLALNRSSSQNEFEYAWKLLLKNHPHDSICGCSVDDVHSEMMSRTNRLNNFIDSQFDRIAAETSKNDFGLGITHHDPAAGADRVTAFNATSGGASAPVFMRWLEPEGSKRFSPRNNKNIQILSKGPADQLFSGWGASPYYKNVDAYEGWVWFEDVPSHGFRSVEWPRESGGETTHFPVTTTANSVDNGSLNVKIQKNGQIVVSHMVPDGTKKTYRLEHKIRDIADGGDTYNFDPIPGDKPIEAKLIRLIEGHRGPLVGSLILTYEISIPKSNVPGGANAKAPKIEQVKRSRTKIKHEIQVEMTLKRGLPLLFFDATWVNDSKDHRLEVVLDTGAEVKSSYSENHLSVVHRHHKLRVAKEKLPVQIAHEALPDRFPAQRFFVANGQVFLNSGMPEYGVEGSSVTMTMLRAVSYLSKPRLWTRGGGAGPNIEAPEANCLGGNSCSYGWAPLAVPFTDIKPIGGGDDWVPRAFQLAEMFEGQLWAALGKGRLNDIAGGVDAHSFIFINNPAVRTIAFFQTSANEFTLRLQNVLNESQRFELRLNAPNFSAELVNFAGAFVEKLELAPDPDGQALAADLTVIGCGILTVKISRT